MANLSIKDITQKTFRVTKKYVDTMVEAVDIAKQNKLTYEDDLEEFKRFTTADAETTIPIYTGTMCAIETLNLEEGKIYNIRTLISTDIPMNISEDLTENARNANGKMLLEFKATAVKNEEASEELGHDILSLEYSNDDCAYEIVIYDKVLLQVNEETDEPITVYSEDHAMISIPFVADYLEIGLKKHIKEELSNDFLKTYKFVTQEDKDNWNNKQDKIKNGVFIKQTPPPDTYGYDKINLITNILEDGLYMATSELSFYDETTLLENGAELYNGKKECSFHVYEGHLFQYTKVEYSTEYCYITNLTTGISCCLDVNGGITAIYATNEFMYLDDVEKMLQYEEVVLELYESDRTGTVNMGTSSKEYQFNNAGFLFDENKIYHVIFEDLDGKKTEITGKAEYDGEFFGNRVLAISEWDNPLIPETHLDSDGTNMIFNIDVKNSLEYNGFGKVTILKVEYVSTEFLETHRFITEEERQEWNEKADKNYVDGFINSGQINISCIDGHSANILAAHSPNDGFNTIYYSTKAYISSSGSIGTEANMNAKAFYEDGAALIDKYATKDGVFELLPAYDTRSTTTNTYEYDKIEEGKVTAHEYYEGVEVQRFVKVADLTAEEFDIYAEKMKSYDTQSSFTQELEQTLGSDIYNSTYEGKTFATFKDADENEVNTILYANACVYFIKQPYSNSYIEFPEAGVYFQTYCEWNTKYPIQMTINLVNGELKVIDKKYLVNSPGRTFEPYSIEYYDSDIKTTFKYRSGEVFNNESNMALEFDSHAEGKETKALGSYSHTEGHKTLASGEASHAEGGGTKARGKYSHAEGFNSHALAQAAHAEGESTTAKGSASHAEGINTIALGYGQHVQGRFNIEDEYNYAHIVGNGDYDARSNAHTLDWNGNAWFAGTVTADGIPVNNNDLVTKAYVDEAIANASLGNGSDVSDSGVIEDSDFDDLISGTFGPEYIDTEE